MARITLNENTRRRERRSHTERTRTADDAENAERKRALLLMQITQNRTHGSDEAVRTEKQPQ